MKPSTVLATIVIAAAGSFALVRAGNIADFSTTEGTGRTVHDDATATWQRMDFNIDPNYFVELVPPGQDGVVHGVVIRGDLDPPSTLYLLDNDGSRVIAFIGAQSGHTNSFVFDTPFTNGLRIQHPTQQRGRGFVTFRLLPTAPSPTCPGDLNGDGITDSADFTILAGDFGCGAE